MSEDCNDHLRSTIFHFEYVVIELFDATSKRLTILLLQIKKTCRAFLAPLASYKLLAKCQRKFLERANKSTTEVVVLILYCAGQGNEEDQT